MRIVFIEAVQNFGGSTKSTLELAKRLKNAGHDVLIIDLWGANKPFVQAVERVGLKLEVIKPSNEPQVLTVNSKGKTLVNKLLYIPEYLFYRKKINRVLEEYGADVVSVNNLKCLTLLKPNSTYSVDFFARTWFESRKISFLKKVVYRKLVSRFLTVSQATRQAIASGGIASIKDIEVLHSVIDSSSFFSASNKSHVAPHNEPIRLFCCGGFITTKGHHIAVLIADELKKRGVKFKLTIIGMIYVTKSSKKYYEDVIKQIKELGLDSEIEIILNETDVTKYFKEQHVLIHPSATEGLPRVGLEALSFGKPVIANPVGGVTDIVIHNFTGFLCKYDDVKSYADYIECYVKDSELYNRHSEQALSLIEQCYLSKNQEEMIHKIYPLISENRSR